MKPILNTLLAAYLAAYLFASGAFAQCPGGVCPVPGLQQRPPAPAWQQPQQQAPATAYQAATVMVKIGGRQGTGTVITVQPVPGGMHVAYALTCAHVVGRDQNGEVIYPGINQVGAAVVATDPGADLALLAFSADPQTPTIPVTQQPVYPGTQVVHLGYPHGRGPVTKTGTILNRNSYRSGGVPNMILSFTSEGGQSGGGVFANGELVGVLWGGSPVDSSATGAAQVGKFLTEKCWWIGGGGGRAPGTQPTPQQPFQPPVQLPDLGDIKGRLAGAETLVGQLRERIQELQQQTGDNSGRLGKVDGVLAKVESGLSKVNDRAEAIAPKAERALEVADKAATGLSWANNLGLLGSLSGPIGIGLGLWARFRKQSTSSEKPELLQLLLQRLDNRIHPPTQPM